MKAFSIVLVLLALVMAGCDHSTNNELPPPGSELAIVNPTDDAIVDGTVPVNVDASGLSKVTKVEFYIDGNLSQARNVPPWQFDWNTIALPSNSYHTLIAKGYSLGAGYSVSQSVTVRKK